MPKPRPQEFDAYSDDYDRHVNSALAFSGLTVDYFTWVKAEYIGDIFTRAFGTKSIDVLDVGCGVGNYHALLRERARSLTGVDISNECLKVARERNEGVTYSHFDGVNLPYPHHSFDAVIAICVYHHVPISLRGPLTQSIKNALRPGGLFLIFEHNPRHPLTMRVINRCEFDRGAVLLKSDETESLLEEAGFGQVLSRHILTIPSFNATTRFIDEMLGGVLFGAQYYTSGRRLF